MATLLLALTVFAATGVDMVEALTIVLAVGVTRGWRSALQGAALAVGVLIVVIGVFGTALATQVPLQLLHLIIGLALLIVGLQWLRKAVGRAAGRRPHRDEAAAFDRLAKRLTHANRLERALDPLAFAASFKGVLLEGLEAAVIVITLGATAHQLPVAVVSAGIAVVLVGLVGAILHRPLTRVPENALKLAVGLLLSSFGTFWVVEGLGREWPGSDLAIIAIGAVYAALAFGTIRLLDRSRQATIPTASSSP
jgi:uncharacterized membrane protein